MRKNVLMSVTLCRPNVGSEAGVGWNVVSQMASINNVVALTRMEFKSFIEDELAKHPVQNLTFKYYELPSFVKKIAFVGNNKYRYVIYDFLWHLFSVPFFCKLAKEYHCDVAQHVNMCQYRILSPCYFLKIPSLIGPLGGQEVVSPSFFCALEKRTQKKERSRYGILDRYIFFLFQLIRKNSKKIMLFSCGLNLSRLKSFVKKDIKSLVVPSIGFCPADFFQYNENLCDDLNKKFTIIYAGSLFDWKGVHLFLNAAKKAFAGKNVVIRLIGIRSEEQQKKLMGWIENFDIKDFVEVIPFMPRLQLIKELTEANLFAYPAFRDSGAMVVLEASALACPTICFDAGGQDVFPDDMMIKVPVADSYQGNVNLFSNKLKWALDNRQTIALMGNEIKKYVYANFTWESKVNLFDRLYDELLMEKNEKV